VHTSTSQYSPPVRPKRPQDEFELPCDDTTETIVGSHRITGVETGFDPAMFEYIVSSDLSSVTFTTIRWELAVEKYGTDVARLMMNRAADGEWTYELIITESVTGCGRPIRRYDLTTVHKVVTDQGVTTTTSQQSEVIPDRSPQDVIYIEDDVLTIPETLSGAEPSIQEPPTSTMEIVERMGTFRTVVMLYWSDTLNGSVLDSRPPRFTDPAAGVYYGGLWALRNESTTLPDGGELLTDDKGELLYTTIDKAQVPVVLTLSDPKLRTAYVLDAKGDYYIQVICTVKEYGRLKEYGGSGASSHAHVEVTFTPSGDVQVTSGDSTSIISSDALTQATASTFGPSVQPTSGSTQAPSLDSLSYPTSTALGLAAFGAAVDSVSSAPESPPVPAVPPEYASSYTESMGYTESTGWY